MIEGRLLPAFSIDKFLSLLQKCKHIRHALCFHASILKNGLESHPSLNMYFVEMLARFRKADDAKKSFDRLEHQNLSNVCNLITGYLKCGIPNIALALYLGIKPNAFLELDVYTFVALIKACTSLKDSEKGIQMHTDITGLGLEEDLIIATCLIDMYGKCGCIIKAEQIFHKLPIRNVVVWNVLMGMYIQNGHDEKVLKHFDSMQSEAVLPDAITFVYIMKACANVGDVSKGQEIHAEVERKGLIGIDLSVGNSIVYMYTSFCLLYIALDIFDNLSERDMISWNTLMTGYISRGDNTVALQCFVQMQAEGVLPNVVTYICALKACCHIRGIGKGRELHAVIEILGWLEKELAIANALLHMYAKNGLLFEAQEIFDRIPSRNVISWNSLISGYAERGSSKEVLHHFEQMQLNGVSPDVVTYAYSLKACAEIGAVEKGCEIHLELKRKGFLGKNSFIGNVLVDIYAKCGFFSKAEEVFEMLPVRDTICWNSLLAGYAEFGYGDKALVCYDQMKRNGILPDEVTFLCCLKACGSARSLDKRIEIHSEIERKGLQQNSVAFSNALVDMYSKCRLFAMGQEIFEKLLLRDVVSWNVLIAGCVQDGCHQKALQHFGRMKLESVLHDSSTFVYTSKACGSLRTAIKGTELQVQLEGLLEGNEILSSAVVDMYIKCGSFRRAQEVFNKRFIHDIISWNTFIAGLAEHGHAEEALKSFKQMRLEGIAPDAVTVACVLKACASIGAIHEGQKIYNDFAEAQFIIQNPFICSSLIGMFGKGGSLSKAKQVFDKLEEQDIVSWNTLILGYIEHGYYEEALSCFEQMKLGNVSPDAITYISTLKACCNVGSIEQGLKIHAEIVRNGLASDYAVGNMLVDMYAKCGLLAIAHHIFYKLLVKDVVSWNSIIMGYTQIGEIENAFSVFSEMVGNNVEPDLITFLIMLNACSRAVLLQKSQTYFELMSKGYGITPAFMHHSCMIDLLSRAGELEGAIEMIQRMPFSCNIAVRHTILGACKFSGSLNIGKKIFEHAVPFS